MMQLNLLPDVKLEYIKARRTKHTVILLSAIISGAAVALFIMFFLVVNVVQKQHLSHLNENIDEYKKTLTAKPELSKILTIQNQLNSLTALHSEKPVVSRTYTYIQQVTPQSASMETLTVNFAEKTIKIEGSANSLVTVNTFVDTLKFTTFNSDPLEEGVGEKKSNARAFSEVVLSDFAISTLEAGTDPNKVAKYTVTLKYDPVIFSDANKVTLTVASKVTTRSETEKPAEIFQTVPTTKSGGNQ